MSDLTPPPVAEWPTASPRGIKIKCPLCQDATGYPPPSDGEPHYWWSRRHAVEHVRCECGAIRVPKAMASHKASESHRRAMVRADV